MKRLYFTLIKNHLRKYKQMVFLAGPRQVGKTTLVKQILETVPVSWYFNWDIPEDRLKILAYFEDSKRFINLDSIYTEKPIVAFDEIHKFKHWKNFLKGFYDTYKDSLSIIVTGSAKLNIYKKGGDSLMGRYFLYRMHPFSISEAQGFFQYDEPIQKPHPVTSDEMEHLLQFGGFPDPFSLKDPKMFNQWQRTRKDQFFKEEIRELSQIHALAQMEVLSMILAENAGQLLSYTQLSKKVQVSINTIRHWMDILEQLYFCFRIRPWHKNLKRSIIKEPKLFLWDWSVIQNEGAKIENMIASHLFKAVHLWTDAGLGTFELFFLRDKEKKEVDFLIAKDNTPIYIIEVKKSAKESLSSSLFHFQNEIHTTQALQVAFEAPFVDIDFRSLTQPKIVPASTFLSQLP